MRIAVGPVGALGPAERAAWTALTAADPALASPYFTLGFAEAVAAARSDARIAVLEDGAGGVGFLGVQGRGRWVAQALGAPLADYQGLIAPAGLAVSGAALARALGVGRIDLSHALADRLGAIGRLAGAAPSWRAELSAGAAGYRAALKARNPETLRQQDKKRRKFFREVPGLAFTADDRTPAHLATLLAWKSAQCRRTGQPAVWAAPWVQAVVWRAFESRDPGFGGKLFTLTQDNHLIAANFFLASRTVLHDWLIAHDPAFDRYSPGVTLARMAVEWAAEQGFAEVDFGPGPYRYKRELTTAHRLIGWGYLGGGSASATVRGLAYAVRGALERLPHPGLAALPGKAMRRLEVLGGLGRG